MKKHVLIIIVSILTISLLTACMGNDNINNSIEETIKSQTNNQTANTPTNSLTSTTENNNNRNNPDPTNSGNNDVKEDKTESSEKYCEAEQALFRADSPKGYSIFETSKSDGFMSPSIYTRRVIDSKGYTVFVLPENEEHMTQVYNGVFLSKDEQNSYLRSIAGEIIISSETLDGVNILTDTRYTSGLAKNLLKAGYILAYRITESYSGVKYEIGFLDTKGKWIVPLSEDNPIIKSGFDVSEKNISEKLRYAGNSIIQFENRVDYGEYDYCLYNITSNSLSKIITPPDMGWSPGMSYLSEEIYFENDIARFTYQNKVYEVSKNGNVNIVDLNYSRIGNVYYEKDQNKYIYFTSSNMVVDSQGNIIKSFDDINLLINSDYNGFMSDTAQIIIKNNEGSVYYTVINIKGDFLFDPVKLDDDIVGAYNTQGNGVSATSNYLGLSKGKFVVIDDTGKLLFTTESAKNLEISNGILQYTKLSNAGIEEGKKYVNILE